MAETDEEKKRRIESEQAWFRERDREYQRIKFVFILVVVMWVLWEISTPSKPSSVKMYDPDRRRAVNQAIEAADLAAQRNGVTLTEDQIRDIASDAAARHIRGE